MTADQAAAHQAVATAILQGCPAEAVYVADRIVVLTNPVAALRWREEYGETFAGRPLDVVATYPLGGNPDELRPGRCRCGQPGCSDAAVRG